jgi:hypothetical protein
MAADQCPACQQPGKAELTTIAPSQVKRRWWQKKRSAAAPETRRLIASIKSIERTGYHCLAMPLTGSAFGLVGFI